MASGKLACKHGVSVANAAGCSFPGFSNSSLPAITASFKARASRNRNISPATIQKLDATEAVTAFSPASLKGI